MAEALGVPFSSYRHYEDPAAFKRRHLPLELTREIAKVLGERGVPEAEVLALGGVDARGGVPISAEDMADQLDAVLLPEIEVGYSMGGGSFVDEFPVVQLVPFSRSWLASITKSSPTELFVARGEGDSMMPTILDQDIVIVDRAQNTVRGQDRIWALAYGGLGMIKRVRLLADGTVQINSDNAAVSPLHANDDEAFIIGRVVAIVRRI